MYGRYGFDELSRFLFLASIVFWALSLLFRFTPLRKIYFIFWVLNTALYIFAIYRILSKNIDRRQRENEWYLRQRSKFYPHAQKFKQDKMDKDYIFKNCPYCHARLRLKRIKGKHTTRCPKCGTQFQVRIIFGKQAP